MAVPRRLAVPLCLKVNRDEQRTHRPGRAQGASHARRDERGVGAEGVAMNWDDEEYVKLYKNSSQDFLALSWQARGLFDELMKVVDRAGILHVGKQGLKGIAIAVRAAWAEIERYVHELLDDGCLRFVPADGLVLIPNFLEAQSARQSDRARARKARQLARATAGVTRPSRNVTTDVDVLDMDSLASSPPPPVSASAEGPETARGARASQNVTRPSRDVTELRHDLSRSEEKREEEKRRENPLSPPSDGREPEASQCEPAPLRLEPTVTPKRRARGQAEATPIAPDWRPTPQTLEWAHAKGVDAEALVEPFRNHWLASATNHLKRDWQAAFRTWVDNEIKWGKAPRWMPPKPPKPPPAAETASPPVSPEELARVRQQALDALDEAKRAMRTPLSRAADEDLASGVRLAATRAEPEAPPAAAGGDP
jgi:hypothetical protein